MVIKGGKERGPFGQKGKKGISPVIATVLLVALVLVLAAIIFLWARSFFTEQIEKFSGQAIEDTCQSIQFDVSVYKNASGGYDLEISNRGNVPLYGIGVKQKLSSGDSEMELSTLTIDVGRAGKTSLNLQSDAQSIIIYPQILGNVRGKSLTKPYTCLNQGIVKDLE